MANGPGYNGTQGIWRYGEDDTETLFSDLLNIGQESVAQQLAADRARLDELETVGVSGTVTRVDSNVGITSYSLRKKNKRTVLRVVATRPAGFVHASTFAVATLPPPSALGTVAGQGMNQANGLPLSVAITSGGSVLVYYTGTAPTAIQGTIIWDEP